MALEWRSRNVFTISQGDCQFKFQWRWIWASESYVVTVQCTVHYVIILCRYTNLQIIPAKTCGIIGTGDWAWADLAKNSKTLFLFFSILSNMMYAVLVKIRKWQKYTYDISYLICSILKQKKQSLNNCFNTFTMNNMHITPVSQIFLSFIKKKKNYIMTSWWHRF